MRYFLIFLVVMIGGTSKILASKDSRPNIILLLTDDQAFTTIHAYGNPQVKTPNIDKLVEKGVSFRNNYATTSICMASRASIMTGMYEYKTGCNFMHGPLHQSKFERSYPVLLRKAGYYTGFAGKFGFAVTADTVKSEKDNTYDVLPVDQFDWWAGGVGQTSYVTAKNKYLASYAEKYPHSTRAYGAACCDFIRKAVKTGKPFCLSMSFKAGHRPNTPDPFFDDVYANTRWEKPANFGRENGRHLALQSKLGRQYINMFRGFGYEKEYQETIRKYQQLIYGVDYAVGKIIEELERKGIADNTVIIFTSDNGYNCGAHGFGGKVLPYEEGSRTPLIIYDPRKGEKGVWSSSLTANIDLAPTILELAGLAIPKNMDGKSLVPVIDNPDIKVREALPLIQAWGTAPSIALTIVNEDYKYLYWPFAENTEASEELFYLKEDPMEMQNVIYDQEHREELEKMRSFYDKALINWQHEAVKDANYREFAVLYNRMIPWERKKDFVPPAFWEAYQKELAKIGYRGDIYDYRKVLRFVEVSPVEFRIP